MSLRTSGNTIERKAEKGPVKLFVRVSPREPRLSDLVEMDVRVESQPGVEIKPPAFGQAVGDFLIRDYSERPAEAGAENVRRFHYQLEPAHAGKHLIRSVSIEFVDKRAEFGAPGEPALIETEPLEVNVTSELGDEAPSLANLEPMLPPRPVPQTVAIGWLVAAASGCLAGDRWRCLRSSAEAAADRAAAPDARRDRPGGARPACWPRICRRGVWSRSSICGLPASSASTSKTRPASGLPSRRRRNSCATCGREPCFRPSVRSSLRSFWKPPTWSSTPGSSRRRARSTRRSRGRTNSST